MSMIAEDFKITQKDFQNSKIWTNKRQNMLLKFKNMEPTHENREKLRNAGLI